MKPTNIEGRDSSPQIETANVWQDALLAIRLMAASLHSKIEPPLGVCVKSSAGPVLERWFTCLENALGSEADMIRVPSHVGIDRLIGGIDLSATLAAGKRIAESGLLSMAHGNALLVTQPQTLEADMLSSLISAMDHQEVMVERDGISEQFPSRFCPVVVHDPDEEMPAALSDRLAIHIDLTHVDIRQIEQSADFTCNGLEQVRQTTPTKAETITSIVELAAAFGIHSLRPPQQALCVARLNAEMHGPDDLVEEDILVALRLALLPRATQFPADDEDALPDEQEKQSQDALDEETDNQEAQENDIGELEDLSIEAILASLPEGLLDTLNQHKNANARSAAVGRTGKSKANFKRGRPISSVRGKPAANKRLDILATLRASAPWQKIRKANVSREQADGPLIRSNDFHVRRFKKPAESTTIFVVDASGSTAINRLGEAKGAVELVLSESYARRDYVAMIAMKGREAEIILPSTRSLVLAKRTLTGLTGGGGTPLADGLRKALALAHEEQRKGRTPSLVVLTDGSANIDLDGNPGREQAQIDALKMAQHVAFSGLAVVIIDVSKLVGRQAKEIAAACHSHYVAMPFANATSISEAVNDLQVSGAGA